MIVAPGSTSVSVDVFFADDTGAALTGKIAADFPAAKWSGGANVASTAITLSDLAAITTAHPNDDTAGGVKEREGGWYRVDLPNNMFTSAGRKILTFAETANKRILAPFFDVQNPVTILADAAHGGTSAMLRLGSSSATPALHVTNSGGNAVELTSTGGPGAGLSVTGSGTGMLVIGLAGMGLGVAGGGGGGQPDIGNAGAAITMSMIGTLSGAVGGIAGTTQTFDALITALNTAHGAGSWLTGSGTSTLTTADIDARLAVYGGPTVAQLNARTLAAADYGTAANQTTIAALVAAAPAVTAAAITTDHGVGSYVSGGVAPTAPAIADAVWDELAAGHVTATSMGALLALAATAADHIGTASITTTSVISQAGDITIVKGDDYSAADGRAIEWTGASANVWPDLTGAVVKLNIGDGTLVVTGAVITPTGTQKVRAEPTALQTATLGATGYTYDVTATLANGHRITLVQGHVMVLNTDAS